MENRTLSKEEILTDMQQETEKIINFYEELIGKTHSELDQREELIKRLKAENKTLRKAVVTALSMLYQSLGKGLH